MNFQALKIHIFYNLAEVYIKLQEPRKAHIYNQKW